VIRNRNAVLGLLVAALLAGQAAYWFASGESAAHSAVRNVLVVVQLAIGLAAAVGFARRLRR
jgi:hypothetical protein